MKRILITITAAAAVLAAAFVCATTFEIVTTFYDEPDADAKGSIVGRVIGDEPVWVVAYEPVANKIYYGSVNGNTYRLSRLAPGKYDLLIKFKEHVLEGIRLDVWGVDEEIPTNEVEEINKIIQQSEGFFNEKKILRRGGSIEERKLLVEQIRTGRTFHHDGSVEENRLIRRIDISIMKKGGQMWHLSSTRFLFREERLNGGPGTRITYRHDNRLSNVRVSDREVKMKDIVLKQPEDGAK